MTARPRTFAFLVAAVVVVALIVTLVVIAQRDGAAQPPNGAPRGPQTTTSIPVTSTTTSRLLPPRPQDLDVRGLDPCKALTTAQEKQLEYDDGWQHPPLADVDDISGEPNCSYQSRTREFGSLISFVANADAQVWLTDPGHKPDLPPKRITVSGFPALQITVRPTELLPDKCLIIVDVHDGQYLDVFSARLAGSKITGSEPYCKEATKVAAMVIENVEHG